MIADVTLGHGAALGEGHISLDSAGFRSGGQTQIDHTDLGAVAVSDDDLVALGNQVNNRLGRIADQLQLLGSGVAQGVAAQSDHDFLAHFFYTSFTICGGRKAGVSRDTPAFGNASQPES